MKTPVLETERLILRPISLDDAPAMQKYFNNWNVLKYTRAPWPFPEGESERNIKEAIPLLETGQQISWAIVPKGTQEAIGRIDYRLFNDPPDRGFWLAEEYHGQGFMTEVVTATQDYVFFELGVERLVVENAKTNAASRRIKQKTGAVFIEEKPDGCSPHINAPTEVWEVTRENWARIRGRQ